VNHRTRAAIIGACLAALVTACASGRVRGGQGTEMQQQQEYLPATKVEPPEGNVTRTSGPIISPTPPPVLEVDLERRPRPPAQQPEPEPEPQPTGPQTKGPEPEGPEPGHGPE
jgi:hypothetical protein